MAGRIYNVFRILLIVAICLAAGVTAGDFDRLTHAEDNSHSRFVLAETSIPQESPRRSVSLLGAQRAFIKTIPDFTQTHVREPEHGWGRMYCGPVSVSNSLAWMNDAAPDSQYALILKLASPGYMDTNPKDGTQVRKFLNGVHTYANEVYGGYTRLQFQGWRKHPVEYSTGDSVPDLTWLTQGISEDSTVWINVGWYTHDRVSNEYERKSGHWVTLAGYDFENSNSLIIHDPAPRAGHGFSNEYVIPKRIDDGMLVGKFNNLPRPAQGFYTLEGGMHIKRHTDFAIMDGAVVFER